MKPFIPYSLLAAAAACGMAFGQAYTTPVGYVSLGASGVALPTGSEITLSVPLVRPSEAVVTVASVSGSQITVEGSLDDGAFNAPVSGAPFVAEIASGSLNGMNALIASNNSNSLTVSLGGGDTLAGLAPGDQIRIREAWTLSSFFSGNVLPDNLTLAAFDVQPSVNNSPTPLYIHFGGNWYDGASGALADDSVLYPGESFLLINETGTDVSSLVVSGEVPTASSRIRIFKDNAGAPQDTRISYLTPTTEPIGDAGFGGLLNDNDSLFVFDNESVALNKSPSRVLIYFGGAWFDGATGSPADDFELVGGEGYILRRDGSAPVGDVVVSDQQEYLSNL